MSGNALQVRYFFQELGDFLYKSIFDSKSYATTTRRCLYLQVALIKLALIDGFWESDTCHDCTTFKVKALSNYWRSDVRRFTDAHGHKSSIAN